MNNGNTQIVRQYRKKYGWEMPSLKLARIIYRENPLQFTSLETVRSRLRYLEGKTGHVVKRIDKMKDRPRNPYNLPESEKVNYIPYKINANRTLVISDIHLPYHSIAALTACFNFAAKEEIDAVLINGDLLDFFQLSRFVKDPKMRSIAHELLTFKQFFETLQSTFNKAKIHYKIGNHEERYEHFLWTKAGELEGVDEFKLDNIIKARAEGIEVISDKRIIKLGGLNVVHGHEFGGSIFSPVNVARGLFLRGKVSAMQGHNHQTSEHTESNMNGEITTTFSLGCLCELHPGYLPINKWNHGFAIVEIDKDDFHVRNYRIYKGEVL